MKNCLIGHRLAIFATCAALWLALSAQTASDDQARQNKARGYLKLAQDNLAKSTNSSPADMGRGDVCLIQTSLGDLAAAKKAAEAIDFEKAQFQTDIARMEARTNKPGAIQYLHTLASTWTSSPEDLATVLAIQAD